MYVCASGKSGEKTTLEKTKQYWLFVPVSKPTSSSNTNSYANTQLIAAQRDSIETRNKKIADQKAAFNKRGLYFEDRVYAKMMHRLRKRALEKRGTKQVSGGTFYIMPTDHLIDMPVRALTGKTIVTRGIKNTLVKNWKKVSHALSFLSCRLRTTDSVRFRSEQGDKSQQWRVTRH